ncbi:MAG: sensor histidine kinase [Chloroflexota bacterium]
MTVAADVEGTEEPTSAYSAALKEYIQSHSEQSLYQASLISQDFIQRGLGPEDIIGLHAEALDGATRSMAAREQVHAGTDGLQFLLETMIAYGVQYKDYQDLRLQDRALKAEERAQDAERLDREKAEILETIAHELRTPITAAIGSVDFAARSIDRGLLDAVPTYLGSAKEALQRLSRLSSHLVAAASGSPVELDTSPQRLGVLVAQAASWAEAAAVQKQVAVVHETSGLADEPLVANADALLTIIGNLLSNAVRYTPPGGRISVRHGFSAGTAWFEVSDTGIGMAPEVLERIFEKFYRAEQARSLEHDGLGLGLTLVRRLVVAARGEVQVSSELGQGSTFRVSFPAQPDSKAQ